MDFAIKEVPPDPNLREMRLEQRRMRLRTTSGIIRSAQWIEAEVREPDILGPCVCIRDDGDYCVWEYDPAFGFSEWIYAWLEENTEQ